MGEFDLNPVGLVKNLATYHREAEQGDVDFLSDFELYSDDGQTVKCHKIILAAQCGYFKGLFRSAPSLTSSTVPVRHSVLKSCIDSLYTGILPELGDEENVKEMLLTANYLGIEEVISTYSDYLLSNIDEGNCCDLLQWSHDYCMPGINQGAVALVKSHLGKLRDQPDSDVTCRSDDVTCRSDDVTCRSDDVTLVSPFMLGLRGLSWECIRPLLLKLVSVIQARSYQIKFVPLDNRMQILYIIIMIIKHFSKQLEPGDSNSILPKGMQSFIRDELLCALPKIFTSELSKKFGLSASFLDCSFPRASDTQSKEENNSSSHPECDSLPPNMPLDQYVDIFMKSCILEEILSASVELTNPVIHDTLYSLLKDYLGSSEEKGTLNFTPYSNLISLVPACLLKTQSSDFVVLETRWSPTYGVDPNNSWRFQYSTDSVQLGVISKISISNRKWDGRNVIKGIELHFQEGKQSVRFGLDDHKIGFGDNKKNILSTKTFKLEEGEYISYVKGRKGWMIDQLTFVTNKDRKFGPIGGDGGSEFSTLTDEHMKLLRSNKDEVRVILRGMIAAEAEQQGSLAIGKVQFITTVMCREGLQEKWRDLFTIR